MTAAWFGSRKGGLEGIGGCGRRYRRRVEVLSRKASEWEQVDDLVKKKEKESMPAKKKQEREVGDKEEDRDQERWDWR